MSRLTELGMKLSVPYNHDLRLIEELAPFPSTAVARELEKHSSAKRVAWVQEEPANAGAWAFLSRHASAVVKGSAPASRGLELVARRRP